MLLADDDRAVRRTGRRCLEKLGYDVLLARDGSQAVELYREHGHRISVVILDLVMPVLDGAGAFEEIRTIDPHAVILFASGLLKGAIAVQLGALGAQGVVQKPYSPSSLSDAIEAALR